MFFFFFFFFFWLQVATNYAQKMLSLWQVTKNYVKTQNWGHLIRC
jgi:hypothetical protein